MAYTRLNKKFGDILGASDIKHMEDGIYNASTEVLKALSGSILDKAKELHDAGRYGIHLFYAWTKPTDSPADAPNSFNTIKIEVTGDVIGYAKVTFRVDSRMWIGYVAAAGTSITWTKVSTIQKKTITANNVTQNFIDTGLLYTDCHIVSIVIKNRQGWLVIPVRGVDGTTLPSNWVIKQTNGGNFSGDWNIDVYYEANF